MAMKGNDQDHKVLFHDNKYFKYSLKYENDVWLGWKHLFHSRILLELRAAAALVAAKIREGGHRNKQGMRPGWPKHPHLINYVI